MFSASPLGSGLAVMDGGLTATTLVDDQSINHAARSVRSVIAGEHGVEFVFWGATALAATVGLVAASGTLDEEVGSMGSLGWRLSTGEVVSDGVVVASGLPAINKGETVGVHVEIDGSQVAMSCYRGNELLAGASAAIGGEPIHFAVSLASEDAGALRCIVNAGQWRGVGPALLGWAQDTPPIAPVRLASEDYMSGPADSPANTAWVGTLASDGLSTVASVSFWPWDTASRTGTAQLKVLDAAGMLDALALDAVRDVPVQVRQVAQGDLLNAASPVGRYVLDRVDVDDDGGKTLVLRDAHDDLDTALHQAVWLPSLNESLAFQPQPVAIGAVRSAPGTAINSDGSVQWVCDAALASVGAVLDRGASIAAETGYQLSDDGQQIALFSPPLGPVLADISTEVDMAPAGLRNALGNVFGRIGKTAWSASDAAEIDTATGYAGIGYYAASGATARIALGEMLPSYATDWWQDAEGVLRLARLVDPDGVSDLAFDLDWRDLKDDLVVLPDLAPNLTRRMTYQPNAAVLDSGDMITDLVQLTPERRQQLSGAARGQVYAGGALPARYAHADVAEPLASRFDLRADAQAEIDRVIALYAVPRFFYAARITGRPDLVMTPGQIGRISYNRYGLQGGRNVLVTAVQSNRGTGDHTLKFWGA